MGHERPSDHPTTRPLDHLTTRPSDHPTTRPTGPIRAVVFDFGGVLLRTEDRSGRRRWEARLGLPAGALDKVVFESEASRRAMVGKAPEEAVWEHVATTFGLDADEIRRFRHDFWSGDRLDEELVRFLRSLRPRYKTAILSNAWPNARYVFGQLFGLDDAVDLMIISAEEGVAKPDPRIYQIALRRLGVRPEEMVFVDDMPENVRAAQTLGIKAVQFTDTARTLARVRALLDGREDDAAPTVP